MAQIETFRFGTLYYDEENVLIFPKGIPGFYTLSRWVFSGEEENPIKWLQSLEDPSVALPVVHPQFFFPDYNAPIPWEELEELGEPRKEDLVILLVVTIPKGKIWEMTANLRAPLIIDRASRKARQVLLANERFSIRAYCLSEEDRAMFEEAPPTPGVICEEGSLEEESSSIEEPKV